MIVIPYPVETNTIVVYAIERHSADSSARAAPLQ